jgi:hypothetical protein
MGGEGLERHPIPHANLQVPTQPGTDSGTLPPDLATVAAGWADLPPALRAGILAMVRAAAPTPAPSGPAGGG